MAPNPQTQQTTRAIFAPAAKSIAYLKAGILGNAGSGKSTTAAYLAIGLVKHAKIEKPVFYLDTEFGSDWLIERFGVNKVGLHVAKTRAFKDLLAAVDEAERSASVLIIDSISHFYVELVRAYQAAKRERMRRANKPAYDNLTLRDWGIIKPMWGTFTDRFLQSKLHIIICGRAQDVFEESEDEQGQKELHVVDRRMKTEKEMGYEPSLLIEMSRDYQIDDKRTRRIALVRKDREPGPDSLDGREFIWTRDDMLNMDKKNVVFDAFKPHVTRLNLSGEHLALSKETSESLFAADSENMKAAEDERVRLQMIEEFEGLWARYLPNRTAPNRKLVADILQVLFGTTSWTAIKREKASVLRNHRAVAERMLKVFVSKSAAEQAASRLDIESLREESIALLVREASGGDDLPTTGSAEQDKAAQAELDLPY